MNIGIQTTLCRINLTSLSIMLKKYNLESQMYHLRFKDMLLHQSHLHLSLIRKIKINKMFALITHTSHVAEHF